MPLGLLTFLEGNNSFTFYAGNVYWSTFFASLSMLNGQI